MSHWNRLSLVLFAVFATVLRSQTLPASQTEATPPAKPDAAVVAGIPVDYNESKVGTYTLADPLMTSDGKKVPTRRPWNKRRPEVEKMFETQQYSVAPGRPKDENFEFTDKGTPAINGKAIRKQITIRLSKDPAGPVIHMIEYLPAKATMPVPMYFDINFGVTQAAIDDPGLTPQKVRDNKTNDLVDPTPGARGVGKINAEIFLDAGTSVASYYYAELDPDTLDGFSHGVRAKFVKPGQAITNEARNGEDWRPSRLGPGV